MTTTMTKRPTNHDLRVFAASYKANNDRLAMIALIKPLAEDSETVRDTIADLRRASSEFNETLVDWLERWNMTFMQVLTAAGAVK